jgi:hypothetical protein
VNMIVSNSVREVIRDYNSVFLMLVILIPKFDLISLGMAGRGLRLFDVYSLLSVFFIFYMHACNKRMFITKYGVNFLLYIAVLILISVGGLIFYGNEHQQIRILSIVRIVEYAVVYVVISQMPLKNLSALIVTLFYAVIFLAGINYIISHERVSGYFAGPWEISTILALLYIGSRDLQDKKSSLLVFFAILITQSRTQLVAFLISFMFNNKALGRKFFIKMMTGILLTLVSFFAITEYTHSFEYINFSGVLPTIVDYFNVYYSSFLSGEYVNHDIREVVGGVGDPSLLARFNQWSYYLSDFMDLFPLSILVGIGGNGVGLTNDSLWIKSVVDYGLVVVVIGMTLYFRACSKGLFRRQLFMFLFITGFMFDFIWSYKIAVVLFLVDQRMNLLRQNVKH